MALTAMEAMESDEQLAARTARGDREAFAMLYERHFQGVYDLALRIARDPDLAADGVQQAFVKAWEHLQRGNVPDHVKAWLRTIARNTMLDELRRTKRFVEPGGDWEDEDGQATSPLYAVVDPDRLSDPEAVAQDREMAELVWQAAAALNPSDYSLLDLHLRQGLSADELAEYLGQRKGSVYTMLSRLRDALEESVALLLLARRGRRDCPELDALLAARDSPSLDRAIRRALRRHADECPRCREGRRRYVAPAEVFAAIAPVPVTTELQRSVWERVSARIQAGPGGDAGSGPDGGVAIIDRWRQLVTPVQAAAVGVVAVAASVLLGITLLKSSQAAPPPRDPDDVRSASHEVGQPSDNPVVHVVWSAQPEAAAYSVLWSEQAHDLPDTDPDLPGGAVETRSPPLADGDWYFHLRTQARDGRWTSTVHLGPFLVRSPTPTATASTTPTALATRSPSRLPPATATPARAEVPTASTPATPTTATEALLGPERRETGVSPTLAPLPTDIAVPSPSVPTATPAPAQTPSPAPVATTPPTPIPTASPSGIPTPSPTSTLRPTRTATATPTSTATATATRTPSPTLTATPTPCPALSSASVWAEVDRSTNQVAVFWEGRGGCSPYSGTITARYQGQPPYQTYAVDARAGSLTDAPPRRCEGTFTVVYGLTLGDAAGRQASASTTARVTWLC